MVVLGNVINTVGKKKKKKAPGLRFPKSALTLKASLFRRWWNKGGLSHETLFLGEDVAFSAHLYFFFLVRTFNY